MTDLFGTDFITVPTGPGKSGKDYDDGNDGGGEGGEENHPPVAEIAGPSTVVIGKGHYIAVRRNGRDVMIPVDEYRREMVKRVLREANNLDEFRQLWIETGKRQQLIDHLLRDNYSPERLRDLENMTDFDIYDLFAHHGYKARALKRPERNLVYVTANQGWFATVDPKAAVVLKGIGHQFEVGGTEALETPTLWEVPEIRNAGGLAALSRIGDPASVMHDAKGRLFAG